jgi:alpha-beta hydrolase superfamily lysophospholipase
VQHESLPVYDVSLFSSPLIVMSNAESSTSQLSAADNHSIPVYLWEPEGEVVGVVQVFHGLGEHAARYQRFANAANQAGFAVCAHDHRGHGARAEQAGFFAPEHGWDLLVTDGRQVFEFLRSRYAGKSIVLLGHSMGSYIAQSYAMRYGDQLAALILSGSTWPSRLRLFPGRLLAVLESWRHGRRGESALLDKLGFGDFNKRFEPARTELDWLSRDPDEVDLYVADSLCGGPYSTGLWRDLLGGLLEVSKNAALRRIPQNLPILITGGADDPVGGEIGMSELYSRYAATGHRDVAKKTYAGGRHEMLNETNRDEFTTDLLRWATRQLASDQA